MPAKKAAGEAAAKPVAAENKPAAEKKQQGGAGAPQKGAGAPQKTGGAPRGQGGNQGQSSPSTTPKVHEISSDPKEAAIQHKLNAIDVKINKLRGDLDKISDDLAAENKSRKDLFEAQKEARNKLNNHGSSSKGAKSQRDTLINKVQELRRVRKLKQDEATKLKVTLPGQPSNEISTATQEAYIKKIDDDIRVLERSLAGAARSLADEKKQVTEISLLRKAKQTYKDFVAVHEKIAQDSKQILDIEAELDKTKESNKNANQERNELFEKLKAIDVQIDDSKKRGDDIAAPRKTINEQIAKLREESGGVRKELSEYRTKAREEANLKRQREYEERKKAREEREARYKAKQEERAKVEEAKTPYEDEIYLCDVLAKYLESLLPQKPKETSSASPAAASSTPEGVTVLKKEKEEDSINNKKDKKQKAVKITQDLKHNVEVFLQFEQISMSPPTKLADVESAITDINTKKEHFEKLSAAAVKDRQEKAAAAATAAAAAPEDKPAENGDAVASE